jgi:transcriptional regulator with XRE-family HTH domain
MGQANTMSTEALVETGLRIERQLPLFGELAVAKAQAQETVGSRIARLRRDKGMTQTELAQLLQVSQPVVSDYENDVIKLSGETVAQLAQILGASADEILGLEKAALARAIPIKNRRLYRQLQNIEKLPKRDQEALLRTIDAFLTKAS